MSDPKRMKLETRIEREVHKYFNEVKEHMHDFVHIYFLRNKIQVDKEVLDKILTVVRTGLEDGMFGKLDKFKASFAKELDDYTSTKNPSKKSE